VATSSTCPERNEDVIVEKPKLWVLESRYGTMCFKPTSFKFIKEAILPMYKFYGKRE